MEKDKKKSKVKIFKGIFCIIILGIIVAGIVVVGVLTNIIDHRDSMQEENKQIAEMISIDNSIESVDVISSFNKQNKNYVTYSDIPKYLVDAVISIEDKRFMEHDGIDYIRTLGAVFNFVKNEGQSNYGGSTITQQLVKVVTNDDERSPTRKIREWTRAIYIETKLSKENIISTYLNTIYLGDNNYGIANASEDFFGKEVKDLTLAECSTIAAIIQSPEGTNPYKSKEARDKLIIRKDVVLKQMYELGKISKEEYDNATNETIMFVKDV